MAYLRKWLAALFAQYKGSIDGNAEVARIISLLISGGVSLDAKRYSK